MATPSNQVAVEFVDQGGGVATVQGYVDVSVTTLAGASALFSAIQACSVAGWDLDSLTIRQTNIAAPGAGPYDCRDLAVFEWQCNDGSVCRTAVPAPDPSVFQFDHETVDLGSPLVIALVAAETAHGTNAVGSPIFALLRGWRQRR
jgi:hypothetical protein